MSARPDFLRENARRIVALTVIVLLYFMAQLPDVSGAERAALGARYQFSPRPFTAFSGDRVRRIREVHPSLEHLSGWISTVGAAIALGDIDGDGLANDACYVDTESDLVIVACVPGTGLRYEPFRLRPASGFDERTMAPMGCVPSDLNEDGLLDILVYYWGRPPVAFLRRDNGRGPSAAEYASADLFDPSERWFSNAATFSDLDGDGHADLLVGNYFPDGAHVLDEQGTGSEELHDSMSDASNGGRNRVFLWRSATGGGEPTVHYEPANLGIDEKHLTRWTLAIGAADLDGDLRPELYFANDFGPDTLLHNRSAVGRLAFEVMLGEKGLTTPNSKVIGRDSFKGMGVDFGDINGDGQLDIHVSNIAAEYALEEAHFLLVSNGDDDAWEKGIAPFEDRGEEFGLARDGWAWDVRFGDYDNDGTLEVQHATGFLKGSVNRWPELHETAMGNDTLIKHPLAWHNFRLGDELSGHQRNPFYARAADGRYYDIAPEVGAGLLHVTRGIATADVDGDGRLDFAYANQWEAPVFYENESPDVGQFLGLYVRRPVEHAPIAVYDGVPSPAGASFPAIGASVRVRVSDEIVLVGQVDGGNGHSGVRSPELHFGLGALQDAAVEVTIEWRALGGSRRSHVLRLTPGWHTIVLGDENEER